LLFATQPTNGDPTVEEWVRDKYGYKSLFLGNSDIVVGMGLAEMNQLFQKVYESDEGVVKTVSGTF
jgi:hypothetical protein